MLIAYSRNQPITRISSSNGNDACFIILSEWFLLNVREFISNVISWYRLEHTVKYAEILWKFSYSHCRLCNVTISQRLSEATATIFWTFHNPMISQKFENQFLKLCMQKINGETGNAHNPTTLSHFAGSPLAYIIDRSTTQWISQQQELKNARNQHNTRHHNIIYIDINNINSQSEIVTPSRAYHRPTFHSAVLIIFKISFVIYAVIIIRQRLSILLHVCTSARYTTPKYNLNYIMSSPLEHLYSTSPKIYKLHTFTSYNLHNNDKQVEWL